MKAFNQSNFLTVTKVVLYLAGMTIIPMLALMLLTPFAGVQFYLTVPGFVGWGLATVALWLLLGWQVWRDLSWKGLLTYIMAISVYVAWLSSVFITAL